jgi:hypothetical protein
MYRLEQKLPLGQDAFKTFVSPLVGSGWEKLAKTGPIDSLGASIRRSLLERCPMQQVHGSSHTPSTSSQKSTKRKTHPTSSQTPSTSSQKSKKRKTHPTSSQTPSTSSQKTIPSRTTSISTSSPITPPTLQQVYSLKGFGVSGASNTYQANQGPHEHQCLRPATPETAQATDAYNVAVISQDISCDHDLGTSAQAGDKRPQHLCGVGNLPLAASSGAADGGSCGGAMNNPARQDQDVEGAPRNAHYVTNQRATEESGDMALPAGIETTLKTGESKGVQGEGKILCYRSRTKLIGMYQFRRSYAFQPQRGRLGELRRSSLHTSALRARPRPLYASAIRIRSSLGRGRCIIGRLGHVK